MVSLGVLVTAKEPAKQSARSSSCWPWPAPRPWEEPGGGGLPTMGLPGEWLDSPGGDLHRGTWG